MQETFKDFYQKILNERYGGKQFNIFYHGTHIKNLKSILKQGLIVNPKNRAWEKDDDANMHFHSLVSLENSIYVSRDLSESVYAAENAGNKGNTEPLLIVMKLNPRILVADEDSITNKIMNTRIAYNATELDLKVDNYLSMDFDPAPYKKDLSDWGNVTMNILKTFIGNHSKNGKIDKFVFDSISRVGEELYRILLFRQASYVKEFRKLLGIESIETAERDYRDMMHWITNRLKFLAYHDLTARVKQSIKYKGRNKIICIFSLPHYKSSDSSMKHEPEVHYGELPEDTIDALMSLE